jgi:hypothetical protein
MNGGGDGFCEYNSSTCRACSGVAQAGVPGATAELTCAAVSGKATILTTSAAIISRL